MKRIAVLAVVLSALATFCKGQPEQPAAPVEDKLIRFGPPKPAGTMSLEGALSRRRSVREFTNQVFGLDQIGQLAWAGQGITDFQTGFRTAPSAGAIYPIELFIATDRGLFVYRPEQHAMEDVLLLDVRGQLAAAAMGQDVVAQAPCSIILAGSTNRLREKYGNDARRFMLLEAGHIAQNIQLQAVTMGLGSVPVGAFDARTLSRACKIPAELEPLLIVCVGYPGTKLPAVAPEPEEQASPDYTPLRTGKRAVLIVARNKFRDEELFETRRRLQNANVQTVIASTRLGLIKGVPQGRIEAALLLNDIVVDDFDAFVFIGGPGAREYFDNRIAFDIVREAAESGKVVGAICIAPTILARAGVLHGVRATAFASEEKRLKKGGAVFTGAAVERDGKIITANGPEAAKQFGKALAEALAGGK